MPFCWLDAAACSGSRSYPSVNNNWCMLSIQLNRTWTLKWISLLLVEFILKPCFLFFKVTLMLLPLLSLFLDNFLQCATAASVLRRTHNHISQFCVESDTLKQTDTPHPPATTTTDVPNWMSPTTRYVTPAAHWIVLFNQSIPSSGCTLHCGERCVLHFRSLMLNSAHLFRFNWRNLKQKGDAVCREGGGCQGISRNDLTTHTNGIPPSEGGSHACVLYGRVHVFYFQNQSRATLIPRHRLHHPGQKWRKSNPCSLPTVLRATVWLR